LKTALFVYGTWSEHVASLACILFIKYFSTCGTYPWTTSKGSKSELMLLARAGVGRGYFQSSLPPPRCLGNCGRWWNVATPKRYFVGEGFVVTSVI
jgi:hypothetical protein